MWVIFKVCEPILYTNQPERETETERETEMSFPFSNSGSNRIDSVRTDQISKNNDFPGYNELVKKFELERINHI